MSFDVLGIIAPHPPIMVPDVGGARRRRHPCLGRRAARGGRPSRELRARDHRRDVAPHARGSPTRSPSRRTRACEATSATSARRAPCTRCPATRSLRRAIVERGGRRGIADRVARRDLAARVGARTRSRRARPAALPRSRGAATRSSTCRSRSSAPRYTWPSGGRCAARRRLGRPPCRVRRERRLQPPSQARRTCRLLAARAGLRRRARAPRRRPATSRASPRWTRTCGSRRGSAGWRSFLALGGYLEGTAALPRVLSYEGPWGVGYLTAVFAPADALDVSAGLERRARRSGARRAA